MIPKFLQGPSGEQSSMRLVFWFYSVVIGVVWAICSINVMSLAPVPKEIVDLLGFLTGAKVTQSVIGESGAIGAVLGMIKRKGADESSSTNALK